MLFSELNEENFLLFAIKNYENPAAVTREDFDKDLNHFRSVSYTHLTLPTKRIV